MRKPEDPALTVRDAEALFRSKPISDIRHVEAATKHQIAQKQEELRQLVGNRYRDLIDSADSILLMKSSSEAVSLNLANVDAAIRSLAHAPTPKLAPNPARARLYSIATRVKYLVDTTENIWGCLDESMFLEAARRYVRARVVHRLINSSVDREFLSNFPLLSHQWQIVKSFKSQISQRARERLMDREPDAGIGDYADALSAVATIDELSPSQTLTLFLDSRRTWISQKLAALSSVPDVNSVSVVFCEIVRIIQVTMGQVGELFLQVLNDMPLFYKTVLESPPGSQLFGGIPNPDEEVRLWKSHRENLESLMVMLEPDFVSISCSSWLKNCASDIVSRINEYFFVNAIQTGKQLGATEKLIREVMESRETVEGTMEWLKSVFGSEIESPWNRICELVLRDNMDLWDGIFEEAFVRRMKEIIVVGFNNLFNSLNVTDAVRAIVAGPGDPTDFFSYLKKDSSAGGIWFLEPNGKRAALGFGLKTPESEMDFKSCLTAYFGPEVAKIRDSVDTTCENILLDLLAFLDSPKSATRLKELAPYLQEKCYESISAVVKELDDELEKLSLALENYKDDDKFQPPCIIVERSLFIGRLLFALRNHSSHIPLILGSPRLWFGMEPRTAGLMRAPLISRQYSGMTADSPFLESGSRRQSSDNLRRQSSATATALLGVGDNANPKLEELSRVLKDMCVKAHNVWIIWVTDELSVILIKDLEKDEALSATTPLRGWEETVIKQEQSKDGDLEIKIALPSMPSLYITSFLFQACQEIHKVGGHILDKVILQIFAFGLLKKVVVTYGNFVSAMDSQTPPISEKGILQILLDLQFSLDILSGGADPATFSGLDMKEEPPKHLLVKSLSRRKMTLLQPNSAIKEQTMELINNLSKKLDPIDWATYESHLWDNERQSYQRYAVLFGFLVQLSRLYTDSVQKLPTNAESNIMRCSTVPRFKYLPISAPALSSRGPTSSALSSTFDDVSSRSSWKAYSNGDVSPKLGVEDTSSFGVAAPLLKSFMTQVGNRFGDSTLKLGSMLTDGQVGLLKDKSVMSTFGDILPVQAAGLFSSFTAGAGKSDY